MVAAPKYATEREARAAAARYAEAHDGRREQLADAQARRAALAERLAGRDVGAGDDEAEQEVARADHDRLLGLIEQLGLHIARLQEAETEARAEAEYLGKVEAAVEAAARARRMRDARREYLDALDAIGGSPFARWIEAQPAFGASDLGWLMLLAEEHAPCLADAQAVGRTVARLVGWGAAREASALQMAWGAFEQSLEG